MLIAIIGENCVGKTTLANKLTDIIEAKIFSGKDYLKLDRSPSMATAQFQKILNDAVTGDNVIYTITEKEHINLLPDGAFKIVLTAELSDIKERFKERLRGKLPLPVERMLEQNHGMYDDFDYDLKIDNSYDINQVIAHIPV